MNDSPIFDLCGFKFRFINYQNKRLLLVRLEEVKEALGYCGPIEEFMDYCKDEREPYYCESMPDLIPEHGIETISESDLDTLICNSSHPQTEAFQNWTTDNAINFIAKTVECLIGEKVSTEDALNILAILQSKAQALKIEEKDEPDEYSTH